MREGGKKEGRERGRKEGRREGGRGGRQELKRGKARLHHGVFLEHRLSFS